MFERYTEKARRVIFFARYEASIFGAPAIEPEHLLLGLIREDRTLLDGFVAEGRVKLDEVRKEVEKRVRVQEKIATSVELPLSAETKRLLAYAHEESDDLGHRHIGTEHLLLGVLRCNNSVAAEVLFEMGISLLHARNEVAGRAGPEAGRSSVRRAEGFTDAHTFGQKLSVIASQLKRHLGMMEAGVKEMNTYAELLLGGSQAELSVMNEKKGVGAAGTGRKTVLGIEKLLEESAATLRGARIGLVCNQASVDHSLKHSADLLHEQKGIKLTALFGPQHGIRGDVQDNMVETAHSVDSVTGLPVHSLYSETREPTDEMLADVDVILFDMQDVGCRIYTFVYTLANCMRAACRLGKRVIVCDRPNPINGVQIAGTVLEPEFASFVGQFPIPTRHGMTVCEMAQLFNDHFGIGCELEVVKMYGWARDEWMDDGDAPWVLPSPNMPTLDSATVFPGTVHLEGTQMSEGRGTTRPFELIGAPYISAEEYARKLSGYGFEGVYFRPCGFQPTFQKHAGIACGGVQIHVTNRRRFEPAIVGVAAVKTAYDMYPESFRWKEPPYEYVYDKNPFDVIAGTGRLRAQIESNASVEEIAESWRAPLEAFGRVREKYLLY
ncbi:MAG TPA: exo-beta-N-acetylmuramidase NamZ domain-containing protein [Pyrinomonadaceae bacterium]|nr:exo-beta-N-acetylmuramidase NamZ domain-containing protein [Pyrinomonadaceae bacterium]